MLIRIFVKLLWRTLNLKNKANRTKLQDDIAKYKKQRNLVVKLKCKPYLSNKHAHSGSKIILIEKEKIINNSNEVIKKKTLLVKNDEIAKTFNKHLDETVETLNTFEWSSNNTFIKWSTYCNYLKNSESTKYHEIKE